jgi:hypothetical protein
LPSFALVATDSLVPVATPGLGEAVTGVGLGAALGTGLGTAVDGVEPQAVASSAIAAMAFANINLGCIK